jgi:hypothetical protein
VEERCVFLDRFIKEVSKLPYLYESIEFQTFLRPNGDLEKALNNLPKQTTDEILAKFRSSIPVNEVFSVIYFINVNYRRQVISHSRSTMKE